MSNLSIIPARALKDRSLLSGDIRVLCAIGSHTSRAGAGCWASSRTLTDEAGVSRSGFFAAVQRLLKAGLIRRVSRKKEGKTSVYSIVFDERLNRTRVQPGSIVVSSAVDTSVRGAADGESRGLDGPTINEPLNVSINAPTTGMIFITNGEKLFAEILARVKYNSLDNGSRRAFLPKEVIESLPEPARRAWNIIGGTGAVIGAVQGSDGIGMRVLQGRFARQYASACATPRTDESTGSGDFQSGDKPPTSAEATINWRAEFERLSNDPEAARLRDVNRGQDEPQRE